MSKFENNINISRRLKNANKWSKIVGSTIYNIFNYPDQKLDTVPKLLNKDLEKAFKIIKPELFIPIMKVI